MEKFDKLRQFNTQTSDDGKYRFGSDSDRFEMIKHLKPVFAMDYLCEDAIEWSFVGNQLGARDYEKLMKGLKRISKETYETLNKETQFHFHDVKWKDVTVKESDFNKCIYGKGESNGDLTPYQVKVFEEARLIGFIYKGAFYLVLFDRGHNAYKRK